MRRVVPSRPFHERSQPFDVKVQIGYVNLQRAIVEVEEGKRAKAALQKTFEKKKVKIKEAEAKLIALRDKIRSKRTVTPEAKLRQEALEYEKERYKLQEKLMKEQQELQALEQKELAGITKKMRKVIDKIGKAGGYTLILEAQDARLLYAKPHLDLTNEVIRRYNSTYR